VQAAVPEVEAVAARDSAVGEQDPVRLRLVDVTPAAIVYERRRTFTATDSGTSAQSG